jgi:hypothetical protein
MDGLVHRPVPGLPARSFPLFSIARLSGPSITTYSSMTKVQALNSTIYEMASRDFKQRRFAVGKRADALAIRSTLQDFEHTRAHRGMIFNNRNCYSHISCASWATLGLMPKIILPFLLLLLRRRSFSAQRRFFSFHLRG